MDSRTAAQSRACHPHHQLHWRRGRHHCLLPAMAASFRFPVPNGQLPGIIAAIVLTAACGFAHEAAFPFMAGLSLLAAMRAFHASGRERIALITVAVLAALGTLHLVTWVVWPRDPLERSAFLDNGLRFSFVGTVREPNLPFLSSTAAAVAIGAAWIQRKRLGSGIWPVSFAFAAFAILIVLITLHPDRMISPWRNFASRGLPVMFTTIAALATVLLRARGISPVRFVTTPVALILLGLMLTQTFFQLAMTERWQDFTNELRDFVSKRSGIIAFAESSRALNPGVTRFRRELLATWGIQPLSIVLAPGGHVRAVVQPDPKSRWYPYHLDGPGAFPEAPGLDWSHFKAGGQETSS